MNKFFREKLVLILIVIIALFGNIWVSYPDIMEIRNFVTAREMVTDGNWLITTMNGAYRFEKPPLPTWITAGFMKLIGINAPDWTMRIPSALMGCLFLYLLYLFIKLLTNKDQISMLAVFIGATTIMFTNLVNENTWDTYTYVFAFATVFFSLKGIKTNKLFYFILTSFTIGASILSKGPVGLYLIYFPFLISYFLIYGKEELKKYWKILLGTFLLGILIAGLWPLGIYLKDKDIFMSNIFQKVINKEVATWNNRKQESIFYYLDYPVYTGIWMLPLVFSFFQKWSKPRTVDKKFLNLTLIWNFITFLGLSAVGMKKKRYMLPLFMTSPMILSSVLIYYFETTKEQLKKSDKFLLNFQKFLSLILYIFVLFIAYAFIYPNGKTGLWYPIFCTILFIPFLIYTFKGNPKKVIIGSGIIMLLGNLTGNWYIDRYLRLEVKKKIFLKYDYPRLSNLRRTLSKEEFYSFNPSMREVWNIGKQINDLSTEKYMDTNNLPNTMNIVTSDSPEKLLEKLPQYKIINTKTYYKEDNDNNTINIYKIQRI